MLLKVSCVDVQLVSVSVLVCNVDVQLVSVSVQVLKLARLPHDTQRYGKDQRDNHTNARQNYAGNGNRLTDDTYAVLTHCTIAYGHRVVTYILGSC